MNQKFSKQEKLKSTKTIQNLFLEGKTISKYPVKVFYLPNLSVTTNGQTAKTNLAAFAVPKRNFKLAVDRNRIKRQLREAYRLNKHILQKKEEGKFVMLFLFLGKTTPKYHDLEKSFTSLLQKISD